MEDFATTEIRTDATSVFVRWGGKGPPVLLLHGFPQTHLMWHRVAPILARHWTVVCADLRGYGRSGCPASSVDHMPYSKRTMAHEMVLVMERLGFSRFSVVGHDRGGRVAYRMALDHSNRIERLAVLDILPTSTVWERADARLTLGYWPWSLPAQAEPLPERILTAVPEAIVDEALAGWGSPSRAFSAEVRTAYVQALRDSDHAHAICEEYRASATIDRKHEAADIAEGHRISCPLLVLWSARDPLNTWYRNDGGPLALWRMWAYEVQGKALEAGHFFPEEAPEETAEALNRFLEGSK